MEVSTITIQQQLIHQDLLILLEGDTLQTHMALQLDIQQEAMQQGDIPQEDIQQGDIQQGDIPQGDMQMEAAMLEETVIEFRKLPMSVQVAE